MSFKDFWSRSILAATSLLMLSGIFSGSSEAAENGIGFYPLGSRGPFAGVTPPPGLYFQNDLYLYSGTAAKSKQFDFNGNIIADVRSNAQIDFPTLLWVTPVQIFGGSLVYSFTEPFGNQSVSAGLNLSGPLGNSFSRSLRDSTFVPGDSVVQNFLGWNEGNFHWQIGEMVNIPIGQYNTDGLANVSFHHWAGDTFGTFTWFDPAIGLDLSGAVGVTLNAENPTTQYKTGDEFHIEWAATYAFTKQFSAGFVGYHYDQFTGDSGSGAHLGPFEGQTTGLGGTAAYTFEVNKIPVSTRIKVFQEFDVRNRLQATTGYLTVSLPIPLSE
jgi:hypothetical protein